VADRSFLARLRTSGGPSHDLLVLLDRHRVMTTGQVARATGVPERTVRYRLDRLHDARLVDCVRPGRESGSAPRHWWLRPAGARLVAGTAAAEGRPSGMFVAHAAAITEVWLALTEHGPAQGLHVVDWLTDRAGWQEWDRDGAWSSRRYRPTPDAVATLTLTGGETVAVFVEVDLASMTQTLLKQKLARYLAYAADRAWEDAFPHCPPLLLLTTTATRAATFVRTAGRIPDHNGHTHDVDDPAAALVVAVCGHVRDPARAVVEPCWMPPETAAAEATLAELLAERRDAQAASEAWHTFQNTVLRRRGDINELRDVATFTYLADWLGSQPAAEVLPVLIGNDPAAFLDTEPDLSRQILDWFARRRRVNRFDARDFARPLVAVLEDRHRAIWADQARRLLAATDHLVEDGQRAVTHPHLHRAASILAAGHLLTEDQAAALQASLPRTREELQQETLGDHPERRAAAVEDHWRNLGRKARRHIPREQIAAGYDEQHLVICNTCEMIYPHPDFDAAASQRCPHCDGSLLDWTDRTLIVSIADQLATIRSSQPR
jgi:transcription initiation factor IIE alpha subunit